MVPGYAQVPRSETAADDGTSVPRPIIVSNAVYGTLSRRNASLTGERRV